MTQGPQQPEELARVRSRIGLTILEFCRQVTEFHMEQLHAYVLEHCGAIAPASADRILRDLRNRGLLNYQVLNRRQSLYRVVRPVTQMNLL